MQMTATMASAAKIMHTNRGTNISTDKKTVAPQKGIRQDSLSINSSKQNKNSASSNLREIIEALDQQKKALTETKNAFIKSTLDEGKPLKSVEVQLKNFDKQLQTVDEMIATAIANEKQKELNKETKTEVKSPVEATPKTKEEIQSKKLDNVISMSADIKNAEAISLLKTRAEGDAKFIQIQMEYDSSVSASAVPKEDLLARVEQSIATMSTVISQKLGEAQTATSAVAETEAKTTDAIVATQEEDSKNIEQSAKISLYEKMQSDTIKEKAKPTFEAVV